MNFALQALKAQRSSWLKSHKFFLLFIGLELILFVLSAQLASVLLGHFAVRHAAIVLAIVATLNWLLAWSARAVGHSDYLRVHRVLGCQEYQRYYGVAALFSFAPLWVLMLPSLFFVSVEASSWLPFAKFFGLLGLFIVVHWFAIRGQLTLVWVPVYSLLIGAIVQPWLTPLAGCVALVALYNPAVPALPFHIKLIGYLTRLVAPYAALLLLGILIAHQFTIISALLLPLTLACCLLAFARLAQQIGSYRIHYLAHDASDRTVFISAIACLLCALLVLTLHQFWMGYLFLLALVIVRLCHLPNHFNLLVIGLSFIYAVVRVLVA